MGADKNTSDELFWPAIGHEELAWVRAEGEVASRRKLIASSGPYLAAVPPEISKLTFKLPPQLGALVDDAGRELTRFDEEAGAIVAPFAAILLRSESASSSEVENLTAKAKQIVLAEIGHSKSSNARLVAGNVEAMQAALKLADSLDTAAILQMHRALLHNSAPQIAGFLREEQVWVGGGSISPHGAQFVAPQHTRVSALLDDMMHFAHRTDIPLLAQIALTHAQFETIHPFVDGNGRTGRALIQAMMRFTGLTRHVTVPVSAGLLRNTETYFSALTAYRSGDITPIVETICEASFAAINNGRRLQTDILSTKSRWQETVRARSDSAIWRLLPLLLAQPVVSVASTAQSLNVSTQSADTAIKKLANSGVLEPATSGRRNRFWQANEVLEALDAFAERARRS